MDHQQIHAVPVDSVRPEVELLQAQADADIGVNQFCRRFARHQARGNRGHSHVVDALVADGERAEDCGKQDGIQRDRDQQQPRLRRRRAGHIFRRTGQKLGALGRHVESSGVFLRTTRQSMRACNLPLRSLETICPFWRVQVRASSPRVGPSISTPNGLQSAGTGRNMKMDNLIPSGRRCRALLANSIR